MLDEFTPAAGPGPGLTPRPGAHWGRTPGANTSGRSSVPSRGRAELGEREPDPRAELRGREAAAAAAPAPGQCPAGLAALRYSPWRPGQEGGRLSGGWSPADGCHRERSLASTWPRPSLEDSCPRDRKHREPSLSPRWFPGATSIPFPPPIRRVRNALSGSEACGGAA